MTINTAAITYANARIKELKQVYQISDIQESELFYLLIEAHDDAKARAKVNEFIEKLEERLNT